jgi:hypothetical protein
MNTILIIVKETIQRFKKDIILFFLLFLLSSISFGLGYLVNRELRRTPIIIEKCANDALIDAKNN